MRINPAEIVIQSTILTLPAILVTITIWDTDPLLVWGYEIAVFALAAWLALREFPQPPRRSAIILPSAAIGLWGFFQLAFKSTVYGWVTLNAALQNLALAATACSAFWLFRAPAARAAFLRIFRWFSLTLAIVSVLSYWTSPGKILWIFPALYPDNWGPFPSRNNFAQFLELSFPVVLCDLGHTRRGSWAAAIPPAILLAAGLASASRAGAVLLIAEGVAALCLLRPRLRTPVLAFALASAAFAAIAGAGVLLQRFADRDPFQYRREIFQTSAAMIQARPWPGYGLGAFSTVYPQFAVFDPGASVEHAHNDWLEWTAEGGPFYAALWAALALWSVRPAWRTVWGLGVPVVFLHALVDYPFARLGISAWVFLLLGVLAGTEKSTASGALSERRTR